MKKGKHISEFRPGDLVIRVSPAYLYDKKVEGINITEPVYDKSYVDEPIRFLEIKDNIIYIDNLSDNEFSIRKLDYKKYQDGWEKYEIPKEVILGTNQEEVSYADMIVNLNLN